MVDLTQAFITGCSSVGLGLVAAFFAFRRLIRRLEMAVPMMIDAYIGSFLVSFEKKPDDMIKQFTPIMNAGTHAFFRSEAFKQELGTLISQMVPKAMEGATVKLPIIGKVPIELIDRFLGGKVQEKVKESVTDLIPR